MRARGSGHKSGNRMLSDVGPSTGAFVPAGMSNANEYFLPRH